ncbi:MAG: PfkB family carbohydrate kinase, partial [Ilumatobacteraceae bacterium]
IGSPSMAATVPRIVVAQARMGQEPPGSCEHAVVIVVMGEALVDLVVGGDVVTAAPGGAPYNVARGCARLGAPTALMATVSGDGFGRRLADGLAESGVDDALLQRTDRPTTLAVAQLDAAGTASYEFYTEGTSAPLLTPERLPDAVDVLVTGGLGLVLEPIATAIESVVMAAGPDVLVLVDLNCRPVAVSDDGGYLARLDRVLARADVVKASDEDLAYLRPGVPVRMAAELLVADGVRTVLVTTGGTATTIVVAGATRTVPVDAVPVVDTIGAGDAFTAGFATWWRGSGRTRDDLGDVEALGTAVRAAHAVAAVVVGRRGSDPPRVADLPEGWATG